jgi:hypothetical protein
MLNCPDVLWRSRQFYSNAPWVPVPSAGALAGVRVLFNASRPKLASLECP